MAARSWWTRGGVGRLGASRKSRQTDESAVSVFIVCTGVGRTNRGYEVQARDLFEALKKLPDLSVILVKSRGKTTHDEVALPTLHRSTQLNHLLCRVLGKRREQLLEYASFAISLIPLVIWHRPNVLYVLDGPLYKLLVRLRRRLGLTCAVVTSTGGQLGNLPVDDRSFLHHVTPYFERRAAHLGFQPHQQFLIPCFIDFKQVLSPPSSDERMEIRRRLGLPTDRKIVLSVGNLDLTTKRMGYVVREVARLEDAPYLVMLGQRDPQTPGLTQLAGELLPDKYRIATVSRSDVWQYYAAADVFVLASLIEGFGLVYVEALALGLPVIAHDFSIARFVLGDHGIFTDLTLPGTLATALEQTLKNAPTPTEQLQRREFVESRYAWELVAERYVSMFRAAGSIAPSSVPVTPAPDTVRALVVDQS